MHTFILNNGLSSRFWNIDLQNNRCIVTSGPLHRSGKTQTRDYTDARRAQAAHDRLIRNKLARGYTETTPKKVPPLQRVLEAALLADPDDRAAHMAYADFLSEQGDPRGELIQVQLALDQLPRHSPQRDALRRRYAALAIEHGRALLGNLAPYLLERPSTYAEPFRFRLGWLDILYVDRLDVGLARALARAPEARLLSTLRIDDIAYESPADYQASDDTPTGQRLPALFVLFGSSNSPNLRWLEVRARVLSREELDAILRCPHFPRLAHLELLNVDDNRLTEEGLRALRATGVTVQGSPSPLEAHDFYYLEHESPS